MYRQVCNVHLIKQLTIKSIRLETEDVDAVDCHLPRCAIRPAMPPSFDVTMPDFCVIAVVNAVRFVVVVVVVVAVVAAAGTSCCSRCQASTCTSRSSNLLKSASSAQNIPPITGRRGGTTPQLTMRYVSRYSSHDTIRITILHWCLDYRLKSKKPKDKRPDSDQLLCFKTI